MSKCLICKHKVCTNTANHARLTVDMIADAAERQMTSLDNPGFCLACGFENDECEPDARRYECQSCGERRVYGAEGLLIRLVA